MNNCAYREAKQYLRCHVLVLLPAAGQNRPYPSKTKQKRIERFWFSQSKVEIYGGTQWASASKQRQPQALHLINHLTLACSFTKHKI